MWRRVEVDGHLMQSRNPQRTLVVEGAEEHTTKGGRGQPTCMVEVVVGGDRTDDFHLVPLRKTLNAFAVPAGIDDEALTCCQVADEVYKILQIACCTKN